MDDRRPSDLRDLEIWFHLDLEANRVAIVDLSVEALTVLAEDLQPGEFLSPLRVTSLEPLRIRRGAPERNVFLLRFAAPPPPFLRLTFHLDRVRLDSGGSLAELARERSVVFVGQSSPETVTQFFRVPNPITV